MQPGETGLKIHIQGSCDWEERSPKGGRRGGGRGGGSSRPGLAVRALMSCGYRPASHGQSGCLAHSQQRGERGATAFSHNPALLAASIPSMWFGNLDNNAGVSEHVAVSEH